MERATKGTSWVLVAAMGLLGTASAGAHSLRTPPIQPGADQKLVCTVTNGSTRPAEISAEIVDRFGDNVTDFAFTDWDASGTILRTLRVESGNPNARFCRVRAKRPARKSDVQATLQACSYDGSVCGDPVAAR
jgi:hypothetical protein